MTIHVEPPRRSRRGRATKVAGVVALALAVIAAIVWWVIQDSDDDPPEPSPSPSVSEDVGPTAAQETALVYYDWLRGRHVAECFTAAGFPREPFLSSETARVPRAAGYLGVEAATDNPSLPSPDLRWAAEHGPGGPDSPPAVRLSDPNAPESCLPDAPALQVPGGSGTDNLVAEARGDAAFLEALAEYVWVAENPAPVALAVAVVHDAFEPTRTDAAAQELWAARLERVMDTFDDQVVIVITDATDQYAHAAGLGVQGGVIIMRVSGEDAELVSTWDRNFDQSCGEIAVSIGAEGPFDASPLRTACNAAGSV